MPLDDINWKISGNIIDPESEINDWQTGKLYLFPNKVTLGVTKVGKFDITISIPEGTSFEDKIEHIEYIHKLGTIDIYPPKEFSAYLKGKATKLKNTMPHMRTYKSVSLERTQ